jgi:hypothetical protein
MNLPELQSCLDHLGVKLSFRLVVDAPVGVMTPQLISALATHKPALLAGLAGMGSLNASASPSPGQTMTSNHAEPDIAFPTSAIVTARPVLPPSRAAPAATESVDDYPDLERAAIMEFDGGLTRAAAEQAAGLLIEKDA